LLHFPSGLRAVDVLQPLRAQRDRAVGHGRSLIEGVMQPAVAAPPA
jgi:hypothetical protein